MKHFVGLFNEQQLKNKEDKSATEKAQQETKLKYIQSRIVKKKGVPYMEVHLVETFEETNFSLKP